MVEKQWPQKTERKKEKMPSTMATSALAHALRSDQLSGFCYNYIRAQNYSPSKKVDLRSTCSKVDSWPKLEMQTIDRCDPNESRLLAEVTCGWLSAACSCHRWIQASHFSKKEEKFKKFGHYWDLQLWIWALRTKKRYILDKYRLFHIKMTLRTTWTKILSGLFNITNE